MDHRSTRVTAIHPRHQKAGEVDIVDARGGDARVLVIIPVTGYNEKGKLHDVDVGVVKAVDDFQVPEGYVRKVTRERSFTHSLRVYVKASQGDKHNYLCIAHFMRHRNKKVVSCKAATAATSTRISKLCADCREWVAS